MTATMHRTDWTARLAPVGLDELNTRAERMIRVDRKYLLPTDELGLLAPAVADARVLEIDGQRATDYTSTYLDTASLDSYHLAGRGRRRRYKVRTRRYAGGDEYLEVKWRDGRKQTHKRRLPHQGAWPLDAVALDFVAGTLREAGVRVPDVGALVPTLVTRYRRTTLLLPDEDARATVDVGLVCRSGQSQVSFDEFAIVETKAGHRLTSLDLALHRLGHRTARISKYGVGLAATTPGLPPEKWRRTLNRINPTPNHPVSPTSPNPLREDHR